ncbi:Thioredoxin-like protein 1 [Oopsacas minuta]|uniref:Thioredoxin-like protein 1 n=1 Tax=Oopsacas minuta TaxID=111878 RepID=A0AAV7K8Q2_9METZ|nr:Thioredoxin-like protein 1 [Oopsacas minuta]
MQEVKIHSICFRAPDLKHAPKTVKLFLNLSSLDFDFVERAKPVQFLDLTEADLEATSVTPLDYLKFQRVQSITVFVKNNQGGEETTQIGFIGLFGSTKESSNMQEFKRIAGKAGESH